MLGLDTNIVVRLIVRDDPAQCSLIDAVLAGERAFVSLSVVLETEWVLRTSYRRSRPEIATVLGHFMAVESLHFEQQADMPWVLDRYAAGADMGDMIHMVANRDCTAFVTLDRRLAAHAGAPAPTPVRTLR